MTKPPKLKFKQHEPLQNYYSDGTGATWSVAKLIDDSKNLPVFDCPLAAIDLSGKIWDDCDIFTLAHHVKSVLDADLDAPILLDWHGCVADGRHRIIKALIEGRRTIKARRITWRVEPCSKPE